ncbi:MAG TPA: hypothetical protein DCP11_03060 [Microbacteriaceae bacterium]|nr:hypothetical protein [Microbacteriaceae bacterium]
MLEDYPLSKDRIGLFNSGLVPFSTYERDERFFAESGASHLRIDLGWGAEWMPWSREVVELRDGKASYSFDETDSIARVLERNGVTPYWSYCYAPVAAREPGQDWRHMAADNSVWVDTVRAYVIGARQRGVRIGYHEVYNEPDLRDERTAEPIFYAGDLEDYLDLYRQTALAIREADPQARIGGPALAAASVNGEWIRRFLAMVQEEQLPLDFLSFHHYGTFSVQKSIDTVLGILAEFDVFQQLELHLNEYNSFVIDYPRGGPQDTHLLGAAFAADLPRLLRVSPLTRVSWAQFLDSGHDNFSGMIDIEGAEKPLYRVYRLYQSMPVERRRVNITGPEGLGAIASSDGGRSAVLAWNRHSAGLELRVEVGAILERARITLVGANGSPAAAQDIAIVDGAIVLTLERGAVVGIELGSEAAATTRRLAERVNYSFVNRAASSWMDVDEATAIIRFGTADVDNAVLVGGVEVPVAALTESHATVVFADGSSAPGSVMLRIDRTDPSRTTFIGENASTFDWSAHIPARAVPTGMARVTAALIGAPAGAFATVRVASSAGVVASVR